MIAAAIIAWLSVDFGSGADTAVGEAVAKIRGWGHWGVVGSIGLMVLHSFLPFPAEVLACANGLVYGPVMGAAVTWIGAMLGAAAAFELARRFGQPVVRRFLTASQADEITHWVERQGAGSMLVARLVPIVAFNLINYAAGLAGIDWWTYLWTTAVGIAPMTVLTALLGDRMLNLPTWIWALLAAVVAIRAIASKKVRSGGVT
ncbi:MAG: TVP38/TMEM64 family protein [Burkholderiales bacterium]|nr:TVP38/TMEM64 family protein [Burkholderiales bacterium]